MFKLGFYISLLFVSLVQISWAGGNDSEKKGDVARGQALYQSDMGCNVCHGEEATGEIGPNIRQTTMEKVAHAMQNFPDMINWQYNNPDLFEEQALLDIVSYLNTLEKE